MIIVEKLERWIIFFLGLAIVLVIMNTMMFNLALPSVARDFARPISDASWIVTGYSITFAVASITYSRLADFLPIRRLFVLGLASLGGAAIAGFFINDFFLMIAVRVLQASGAGAIPGLALVFVSRYIPLERRGRAMAKVMAAVGLGLGLGPVIGGVIVEYLGWHFLFLLTAASLLLIPAFARLIPVEVSKQGSFDATGASLSAIGITALLLALTQKSLIATAVGCTAVLLFALRIRSAAQPFVLPALFSNSRYLLLGGAGIGAYMLSFALLFIMPQMLIRQYQMTAIEAGLVIFPGSLAAMLLSPLVGKVIDRTGNAGILRYIPVLLFAAALLFALLAAQSAFWIMAAYTLLSIAFTFLSTSVSNEMSRILKKEEIGSGLGLFQLMQFFSGAFGVALAATALVWQKDLPPQVAYTNIFRGMALVALLSVLAAQFYLRGKDRGEKLSPA
ncbi:MAG: MFS transporter [Turneriella sp.]|nr:MFS transporter [Turneriella sp.]